MELKITNNYNPDSVIDRIGILLSGGLDSVAGFYNLCNELIRQDKLDVTIVPFHYVDTQYPVTESIVNDVVTTVKASFPSVTISDAKIFNFDLDYVIHRMGWTCLNMAERDQKFDEYVQSNDIENVVNFRTMLPPREVWKKWSLYAAGEPEGGTGKLNGRRTITGLADTRNTPHPEYVRKDSYSVYSPYAAKTKMYVKEMFNEYNVPERFVDDTRSCTRVMRKPITNHKPGPDTFPIDHPDFDGTAGACGECYHCWEKKWAFGKI